MGAPYDRGPMKLLASALACCLALTGCALWGRDAETATICERGFTNDKDWTRASPFNRTARALWKKAPSIEFESRYSAPSKPTTIWFKNAKSPEFASCSRHNCDTGLCLWRVRLYSRQDDQLHIRMEYDLGRPRAGKTP